MAGVALSGMASGLDTDTMVTQLMAVESQGKNRLIVSQYREEARKTNLDQIASKLRLLKSSIDDMRSAGSWGTVQTVASSDPTRIDATFKSGAAVGSYGLEVTQLARADQSFWNFTPTAANPKTITLGYAGDTSTDTTVTFDATATVDDIAAKINGNTKSAAFASVVGGELVLSGKKTGVNLDVRSTELQEDTAKRRASREAIFAIDGVEQLPHSPSNVVAGGLPGVDLTLKALTNGPVTLTVGVPGPDQAALKAKVKAFVDSYNATIDLIKGKLSEESVKTPATTDDYAKGILRGDPGLTSLLSKLRQTMGNVFTTGPSTGYDRLSDIGVSVPSAQVSGNVSDDRLDGKLVIDDAKLTAALNADPAAVRTMLGGVGGTRGATQVLDDIIDPVANLTSGTLTQRSSSSSREITRIKDAETAFDARMKLREERLRAQFALMETALSKSQATTGWLSGQISGMSTSG